MRESELPLPEKIRPSSLKDFIGQKHLLGEGRLLNRIITSGKVPCLLFWGPAGCGKTSLGFIITKILDADFFYLNAAFSSVKQVKESLQKARERAGREGKKQVLFIDEIHRFNKLQQETLVPDTEKRTVIFIGATVYNPRYYLIPSLISRTVVAEFKPLNREEIISLLKRALKDKEKGLGEENIRITNKALEYMSVHSGGDARKALTGLEIGGITTPLNKEGKRVIDLDVAREVTQKNVVYDRQGYHFDNISAFIKSVRGSDPDSSVYWLAKMLTAGEDPRFIARRLIILASEDIGNANPFALVMANNCFQAVESIGMPEAGIILSQAAIYCAVSPKSNACYLAVNKAMQDIEQKGSADVPGHLKPHSPEYKYPHDFKDRSFVQDYGAKKKYYFPGEQGEEKKISDFIKNLKAGNNRRGRT